jgi:hypothetical protein
MAERANGIYSASLAAILGDIKNCCCIIRMSFISKVSSVNGFIECSNFNNSAQVFICMRLAAGGHLKSQHEYKTTVVK